MGAAQIPRLSPTAARLLELHVAMDKGELFMLNRTVGERLGVSRRTVQLAFAELVAKKLVTRWYELTRWGRQLRHTRRNGPPRARKEDCAGRAQNVAPPLRPDSSEVQSGINVDHTGSGGADAPSSAQLALDVDALRAMLASTVPGQAAWAKAQLERVLTGALASAQPSDRPRTPIPAAPALPASQGTPGAQVGWWGNAFSAAAVSAGLETLARGKRSRADLNALARGFASKWDDAKSLRFYQVALRKLVAGDLKLAKVLHAWRVTHEMPALQARKLFSSLIATRK